MTGSDCSGRKHTPIVTERQRGFLGRELGNRRAGRGALIKSITTEELESHLREAKGKKLPAHR